MLAVYTSRGVTPEVNLRECISHTPPQSSNKAEPTLALKPRGDVTRSPKQGYQWPHKWTCVQQKFKKKKKKRHSSRLRITSFRRLYALLQPDWPLISETNEFFRMQFHRLYRIHRICKKKLFSAVFENDNY